MRILFWFLLLAAAAVGVALLARITDGYALFVAPPYRVELSLNLLLLLAGRRLRRAATRSCALVRRALALPAEVRAARRRQQQERARAKQDAAMVALLEGRYGKARQFAGEALAIPQSGGAGGADRRARGDRDARLRRRVERCSRGPTRRCRASRCRG